MRIRLDGDPTAAPRQLAVAHRGLPVGEEVRIDVAEPDRWPDRRLADVVVGAGFGDVVVGPDATTVRAERARSLADTVGPDLRLLICGLNPSEHAADAGVGFVTPSNRFWKAATAAGLVDVDRDVFAALDQGVGMTDLVKRATRRADALTREEYAEGLGRLDRLCAWLRPDAVCSVGLAGWRAAVDRRATPGWQERRLGGRPVYLMPSTSGLNASSSFRDLVFHLRAGSERPRCVRPVTSARPSP